MKSMNPGLWISSALLLFSPLQGLAQTAGDGWQLLRQGQAAQAEAAFGALIGRSTTDPDEAMYEAKKAGRNRVSTLDTSQD